MVGAEMAADLLAFGKPILVLGDPGQLPPIRGDGAFTDRRAGRDADRDPPPGRRERDHTPRHHGPAGPADPLRRARRRTSGRCAATRSGPEQMLRGGQVICGRNATRVQLNLAMKRAAGFPGVYPTRRRREDHLPEEPRRHRHRQRHVPGALGLPRRERALLLRPSCAAPTDEPAGAPPPASGTSSTRATSTITSQPDREREQRDHWIKKGLIEAVWGYAITCHKSAGLAVGERHRLRRRPLPHAPRTGPAGSTPRSPAPRAGW